ncbi:hypothetical protein ACFX15_034261 [Malus domestica]
MKDLGGLKYFLGIEVARSRDGIYLSQRKYVLDLLAETGMLACKPAETPIVQNHHLANYPDQVPANRERYQRLVGRLIYLSLTRPDIAYAVSVKNRHLEIKGYTDADWAGNITDRRSTSGYFTFVGGNLVTWRSKKQNVVARSTAEAEYREKLIDKLVEIPYVRSEDQLADVLTHAVSARVFQDSLDKLGLGDIYAPT